MPCSRSGSCAGDRYGILGLSLPAPKLYPDRRRSCGGRLSNLIDRLLQDGSVTGFLNIGVGPVRTGIFNSADMALMLGVAILVAGDRVADWLLTRR